MNNHQNTAPRLLEQEDLYNAFDLIAMVIKKDASHPSALCEAGKAYFALLVYYQSPLVQDYTAKTGQEIDYDFLAQQTLNYLNQAAERKNGLACHYLGHIYQNGMCNLKPNISKAIAFFEQAIEYGYALSQQRLGYFYQKGIGVDKDIQKAFDYYQKVVGNRLAAKGQRNVSYMFAKTLAPMKRTLKTNSLPPEYVNTLIGNTLIQLGKKIENGLVAALTNLGLLYLEGEEIPQNRFQAYEHLNEAAKLGCPNAQMSLGTLYQMGSGVKQDLVQAAKLYREAADQGHVLAQLSLGHLYDQGEGISQDVKQAKYYFELAAWAGNADAQVRLGYYYYKGISTEVDFDKAFFCYQKAAEQNHPMGLKNLGAMYYQGLGVAEDREMATLLWEKAE